MARRSPDQLTAAWSRHSEEWRHPAQVVSHWADAGSVDPELLRHRATGDWWATLERLGVTLLVTREYEHLVVALAAPDGKPSTSFLPLPHPSGLVADRAGGTVFVASTRNPNQVFDLLPVADMLDRSDVKGGDAPAPTLLPVRSRYYPGALYMHDLAILGGELVANAVGQNAVVRLGGDGGFERVWWPKSIEGPDGPRFDANYLQVNSIAAGDDVAGSYFTASAATPGRRRPGHRNFPVDGRGVVFSGATGEVVATGLTRPHSARLRGAELWVDNSGYGEVGRIEGGRFEAVRRLPGWTRGLSFVGNVAFVGTSRVIPRFRQYAPGLDEAESVCAVHALDVASGTVLGSLTWPAGNQIFAIDWLPAVAARGFPFRRAGTRATPAETNLFYTFSPPSNGAGSRRKT